MDKNNEEDKLRQQMRERYEEEEKNLKAVIINDLMCKDCRFTYSYPQLISICEKYPKMKPGKVLYGGSCDEYNKR